MGSPVCDYLSPRIMNSEMEDLQPSERRRKKKRRREKRREEELEDLPVRRE